MQTVSKELSFALSASFVNKLELTQVSSQHLLLMVSLRTTMVHLGLIVIEIRKLLSMFSNMLL